MFITIGHFLAARGSQDRNAFAPQTQAGTGFYSLESVVATGGMGAVLKAKDNNLARTVALKVMLNSANANEHTVFNFVAEAQITGQLEHPNIVPLHDIGVAADGTIYYTMKLIEGRTLRDILKDIREGNQDTIQCFPISRLLTILLIGICFLDAPRFSRSSFKQKAREVHEGAEQSAPFYLQRA